MANVIVDDTYLGDIADAIRSKNNSIDTYTPAQMAAAISALQTGGGIPDMTVVVGDAVSNANNAGVYLPNTAFNYKQIVFAMWIRATNSYTMMLYTRNMAQKMLDTNSTNAYIPLAFIDTSNSRAYSSDGLTYTRIFGSSDPSNYPAIPIGAVLYNGDWRTGDATSSRSFVPAVKNMSGLTSGATGSNFSGTWRLIVGYES